MVQHVTKDQLVCENHGETQLVGSFFGTIWKWFVKTKLSYTFWRLVILILVGTTYNMLQQGCLVLAVSIPSKCICWPFVRSSKRWARCQAAFWFSGRTSKIQNAQRSLWKISSKQIIHPHMSNWIHVFIKTFRTSPSPWTSPNLKKQRFASSLPSVSLTGHPPDFPQLNAQIGVHSPATDSPR